MLGEFQIIFLYVLTLFLAFFFATLLRIHLDASEKREINRHKKDKSFEILEEVNIRDTGCDIDQCIRELESEEVDISPRYKF